MADLAPWTDRAASPRWFGGLLCALLAGEILYLAFVGWRLPVDYWDGYEYLMNARTIAGHEYARLHHNYIELRPPLLPLVLAVVLQGYAPGGLGTSLWGPHLVAVALSVLSIGALYWLLRQAFSPSGSLLGCIVLAMNPLFIHYAPFVMTDIPAMLFVTVAAVAYLRAAASGRFVFQILAGAALGAATTAKYTSVFVLGVFVVFEISRVLCPARGDASSPGLGRRARRLLVSLRPWVVLAAAWTVFYLLHALAYARALPSVNTLAQIGIVFRNQMAGVGKYMSDPLFEYLVDLPIAFSLPLCVIALVGMVAAAWRRTDVDLLCLSWFVVFFGAITFFVGHKEARYAFPVLPPLVYFIGRGMQPLQAGIQWAVSRVLRGRITAARRAALASLVIALAVAPRPMALAGRELARFSDPVYAKPFLPTVARWVLDHSAQGEPALISRGFLYTMYPADPLFSPYDEFFYFHHIPGHALAYLLDRPLVQVDPVPLVTDEILGSLVDRFEHSAVVLGSNARYIDTNGIFLGIEPPDPLRLTFIDRRTLRRDTADNPPSERVLYHATDGPDRLTLGRPRNEWKVVEGMPEAAWHLYQPAGEGIPAVPFDPNVSGQPPPVLELIRVEQREISFR